MEAWGAVYSNFVARVGNTRRQYEKVLAETATYLASLGNYVTVVRDLFSYELFCAGQNGAILQRYRLGAFGRGQFDPTDIAAVRNERGDVSIRVSQAHARLFKSQLDGTYRASPGDYGLLIRTADTYELREQDGSRLFFGGDGKLVWTEDPNGNSVSWRYTNGRVTSWVDSWGDTTEVTYNANGRITQTTDPVGRNTTFVYDAAGEHLTTVTAPAGTSHTLI
jgi:YD repeat-containing protein